MSKPPVTVERELLSARETAAVLGVSTRHVFRLVQLGRMPKPLRLGGLVKWRRVDLQRWLAAGCPPVDELEPAP